MFNHLLVGRSGFREESVDAHVMFGLRNVLGAEADLFVKIGVQNHPPDAVGESTVTMDRSWKARKMVIVDGRAIGDEFRNNKVIVPGIVNGPAKVGEGVAPVPGSGSGRALVLVRSRGTAGSGKEKSESSEHQKWASDQRTPGTRYMRGLEGIPGQMWGANRTVR